MHDDDSDLAPPGSGCIFGPGPAQADAPDVEPGEPLGYLVRFGHGDRAGLQFHRRDADRQAAFVGNGATVVPLVAEPSTGWKPTVPMAALVRDLLNLGFNVNVDPEVAARFAGKVIADPTAPPWTGVCWCGQPVIAIADGAGLDHPVVTDVEREWCREHAPRCRSGAHFKGNCRCAGQHKGRTAKGNPDDLCGMCGRLRREHNTRHDTCTTFQEP